MYRSHVGGGWFITVQTGYFIVNLRRYWLAPGALTETPTKTGICLRFDEWNELKKAAMFMYKDRVDLKNEEPCNVTFDHKNLLCFLDCKECSPFKEDETEKEFRAMYGLFD